MWYDNFVVNASASMRMGWKHPFLLPFRLLIILKKRGLFSHQKRRSKCECSFGCRSCMGFGPEILL